MTRISEQTSSSTLTTVKGTQNNSRQGTMAFVNVLLWDPIRQVLYDSPSALIGIKHEIIDHNRNEQGDGSHLGRGD